MADHTYLDCDDRFLVGAKLDLSILCWDETNPNLDISALTATCSVYNEIGTLITSGACSMTGTTLLSVKRLWDTTGLTPGKHRIVITTTLGTHVQLFQFAVILDPNPGAQ